MVTGQVRGRVTAQPLALALLQPTCNLGMWTPGCSFRVLLSLVHQWSSCHKHRSHCMNNSRGEPFTQVEQFARVNQFARLNQVDQFMRLNQVWAIRVVKSGWIICQVESDCDSEDTRTIKAHDNQHLALNWVLHRCSNWLRGCGNA
jgi:hypothetical protein